VEASRKHGSFDMRWSCAGTNRSRGVREARLLSDAKDAEALDWDAFSSRYFPERGRHDLEALTAYTRYTQGHESQTPSARLRLVPPERTPVAVQQKREDAGPRRLMAAMAAAHPREA